MKYFSTFTGIGGFEIGIHNAYLKYAYSSKESESKERSQGRQRPISEQSAQLHVGNQLAPLCVGYSEIDKYATSVYEHHFKGVKNYGDITKINADELPDFDCLIGGFPCQAFSIAGRRAGFDDTRGTLFFDLARILRAKRPRLFVFENVKGLLNHDNGRTFATIIAATSDLGYDCQWQVLNSKNHGVPQNRERVIIVGHLRGTPRPEVFPFATENSEVIEPIDAKIVIGTLRTHNDGKGFRQLRGNISPTIPARAREDGSGQPVIVQPIITPDRLNKQQNGRRFKESGEPAFTVTAQDRHGVLVNHGELKETDSATTIDANYHKGMNNHGQRTGVSDGLKIRRLTPLECERLQGFPDNWTSIGTGGVVSDSQKYKMCGNAVTTNVIRDVFERIFA